MPNVKIYVDERVRAAAAPGLSGILPDLRAMLCEALGVDVAACQLAVIAVTGLPDQPPINAELAIMPRADRTRERITATAEAVRAIVGGATGQRVAVRVMMLDAATYVALK